ncbi:MAG: four helix bundle protein [Candidatus Taylorbacteria bacterium RIFCSPHIGHO2_01_FULL_51_15]|uniref:Four helix bundle protein n=1 Tax=Candidatus Taylorbacteria bacterium RIFCSPHIGHO2_01_FULL_51_15 TaxID=1802304 RepID=A0A1G2M9G7_9BACT|nr:MAG: four helix bundle protein [Candidatus Taylorbacteria bacterium RIFCSPHIGHO2_01_FULL_51_15]
MTEKNPKYDLEERTAKFGEAVVLFAKKIPVTPVTQRIIPQLVASGTSIGSNYCEADDAESGRDFVHKLGICKKEARETKHWLRIISVAVPELRDDARVLWKEANELNLIFNAIVRKVRNKGKVVVDIGI